jgi:hypothetical protein
MPLPKPVRLAVTVSVAGAVPLDGVTDSHCPPEVVRATTVKAAGCPLLPSFRVLWATADPIGNSAEKSM